MNSPARTNYNRLSRWYDLISGAGEARLRREGLALLDVRPGEAVLEVGCGTGAALAALGRAGGPQSHLAGVDLAEGMLKVSAARLRQAGLADRVSLAQADAAALPYPAQSFDAAFMAFTLELFPEPVLPIVLAELRRVLRPGGRLGVVALAAAAAERPNAMISAYAWFQRRFPQVVDCRPIPAGALLAGSGLQVQCANRRSLWGLAVDILLAIN